MISRFPALAEGADTAWAADGAYTKMVAVATRADVQTISSAVDGLIQGFTHSPMPGAASRINSVKVLVNSRAVPGGTDDIAVFVRLAGVYTYEVLGQSVSFADYTSAALARPGGGTWTKADVDAAQFGVRSDIVGADTITAEFLELVVDHELYKGNQGVFAG